MMKILVLILLLVTVSTYDFGTKIKVKKFFEVILDRCEILHENKTILELHIQVRKINKTRSIVGYLTYHQPIGNDFTAGIKMLKKQGNEYRYMPYQVAPGPFCDVLSDDKYIYPEIARKSDFPEDLASHCPLPAGNYSFHGTNSNLDNVPTIMLQTGEYAAELYYELNGRKVATYRLFGYVNSV